MARRPRHVTAPIRWAAVVAFWIPSAMYADHYDFREIETPIAPRVAEECMVQAKRLGGQRDRSATELVRLYDAEICIGKFATWAANAPEKEFERRLADPAADEEGRAAQREAREYLHARRGRFRIVSDGWKNEDALWEPNAHWLEELRRRFPDTEERWEIEWDQAWKQLTRKFSFARDARGKSCKRVYDEIVAGWREDPRNELYSEEESARRVTDCEEQRARFRVELREIERRFSARPARKRRAFEAEPEDVISNLYFGLC